VLWRRALHVASMVAAVAAGWSASAEALPGVPPPPITVPSLTLPTVTVPPVTTPVVTTPPVTTPTVTVPPPIPAAPLSRPSASPGGETGGAGSATTGESGDNASRVGRDESSREQASRLGLARDWIARRGTRGQRRTTFVFVLRKPATVELVFLQMAPDCRRVGRLRVRGHRGVNRLRLRTRIGRHRLAPGTYSVVARALPAGRAVGRARFVVVDHAGGRELRAAREANACGATASLTNPGRPPSGARPASPGPRKAARPTHRRGTLGARFGRGAFSTADEIPVRAYTLLALAIALLVAAVLMAKAAPVRLSAAILLALVGSAIILGLTITYALV